jgi:hypothetical protein
LRRHRSLAQMRQMVAQTSFAGCDIREDAIGMQVWLEA